MATHARLIASVSWANGMNYQSDLPGGIIWDLWRPCFFNELENNIFFEKTVNIHILPIFSRYGMYGL